MEFGADQEPAEVVEDRHQLSFGDGLALVLGPSASDNVGHRVRYVVPVLRLPERPADGRVAVAVVGSIPVADLHPTTFHNHVRPFGGLAGRIAASLDPGHMEFDRLRVGRQFLAQVIGRGQPVVALKVGHVVVGDRQSTPVVVVVAVLFVGLGRRRHHPPALQVRHQPARLAGDFRQAQVGGHAATGAIEAKATRTSFRIVLTEVEESGPASVASFALDVRFALTGGSTARIGYSGRIASARLAIGETVVAGSASIAFASGESDSAPTLSGIRVRNRSVAAGRSAGSFRMTSARKARSGEGGSGRAEVSVQAFLAVDARREVGAVEANASALENVVNRQTPALPVHLRVVAALLGVPVTLALLANGRLAHSAGLPGPLVEERTAALAVGSARVVLAATLGPLHFRVVRAGGSVSVADALAADGNVLDGIKEPLVEGSIRFRLLLVADAVEVLAGQFAHQIGIERPDLLQPKADVSGLGEVQQLGRRKTGSWPSFDQRRVNLSIGIFFKNF